MIFRGVGPRHPRIQLAQVLEHPLRERIIRWKKPGVVDVNAAPRTGEERLFGRDYAERWNRLSE